MIDPRRDHLFISYAWENGAFAEWLALRLTREGYRAWCDRFKLLGGESYPRDIDRAIREQTFRLLALMSRDSVNKPNPLKERTLALNLARDRKEDFLIPLNVDGLPPTEVGWMLSDITYIPFHRSWAEGFAQLLKKLQSLDAPRPLADGGRAAVVDWFAARETVSTAPERLWSNLLPIEELPSELLRITVASQPSAGVLAAWPHHRQNDLVYWAFEAPADNDALDLVDVESVPRDGSHANAGLRPPDIATKLIRAHISARALSKGMVPTPDDKHLYFPPGLVPGDRLWYVGCDGKRTFVQSVGERTFRVGPLGKDREKTRYHLSPTFRPNLWKYEQPVVQVQIQLFLTDPSGKPLPARKAARRRKAIGKNGWNHEWLSRTLATASWLSDGADQVNLASAPGVRLSLAGRPPSLSAPVGIDETSLAPIATDEDAELTEDAEGTSKMASLTRATSLPESVKIFREPPLEFRYGQAMTDPHDGLAMFGPYDTDMPSHPKNISYALIGTSSGMSAFRAWARTIQSPVYTDPDLDTQLWPMFPGFEAAFACTWPVEPSRQIALDAKVLDTAARDLDPNKRAAMVVEQYLDGIARVAKRDDPVHLVVCVVPDLVWENCRPKSRVRGGMGYHISPSTRQQRERGQRDLFDTFDPAIYQFSVDFRRQIKARSMRHGIPIQIIRESTLRLTPAMFGQRGLTPLSDRAWNLTVAAYYKAGGKPWRLSTARQGVCYIGLAYRRKDPTSTNSIACCAAQMFLDSGDGIVFMGEYGPWYSPTWDAFHLTPQAARRLLEGVLLTYRELEGPPLQEIFLHSRSGFNEREFEGFREACPSGVDLVGVRVRQERLDVRLYREGARPVLRGTFWSVRPTTGYLWASGFKPRLGTYDGSKVPVPLRIDVQQGTADLDQVGSDIFSLTKLNYNACKLGDGEPVTVGFSDDVGEILVSNPTVSERSPKFRFYI